MWFDLHVRRDFWGVFKKIRGNALVSRPRSSANKIQRNLFCGSIAKLFIILIMLFIIYLLYYYIKFRHGIFLGLFFGPRIFLGFSCRQEENIQLPLLKNSELSRTLLQEQLFQARTRWTRIITIYEVPICVTPQYPPLDKRFLFVVLQDIDTFYCSLMFQKKIIT